MLLWLPKAPTWFSSCENISGWSSQITLYVWHWSLVIMFFGWKVSHCLFRYIANQWCWQLFQTLLKVGSVLHDFSCWEAFLPLCCFDCLEKGNPFSQIVVFTIFNCAILHCWSKQPDWGNLPPFCECLTMPFPGIMPYKCASTRGWGFNNVWIIYLIKMIIFLLWTYRNLKFVYWKCKKYPWKFH